MDGEFVMVTYTKPIKFYPPQVDAQTVPFKVI